MPTDILSGSPLNANPPVLILSPLFLIFSAGFSGVDRLGISTTCT
jgi:hypothetical protein